MKPLLSPEGELALAALLRQHPLLLAFDFDGTLAPIVARPDEARVPLAVSKRLRLLAEHYPIAIISGRMVDDVRQRLSFQPSYIVGNHGAEAPGATDTDALCRTLDGLRIRLQQRHEALADAGITIEDKRISIALHYRLARHKAVATALIADTLAGLDPRLKVFGGKLVTNVVVAAAHDKADALLALVTRSSAAAALFIGDDVNDEPVFQRAQPGWLTIRIGRDAPQSAAQYFLNCIADLPTLLDKLLPWPA